MTLAIVRADESHFESLRQVIDTVARERTYLAFLQAPPPEQAYAFFRNVATNGVCQFVAVADGAVIGWCDIVPTHGEARAHVGTLGMGVLAHARHRGIGTRLIDAALSAAWQSGLSRIELTVRTDNLDAGALYQRCGFVQEGVNRKAFCVDGRFYDTYTMALVR